MAISIDSLLEMTKPVVLATPDLGELTVDIHGELQDWLTKGLDAGRWSEGRALVRDIVAEQVRTPDDQSVEPGVITRLDDAALDDLAAALFFKMGGALRPRWVERKRVGRRRRARKRRDDEAYDLTRREDETECDRLHRVARDWRDDRRLRDEEFTSMSLGPNYEELIAATRRASELDTWSRAAGLLESRHTYLDAIKVSQALDPAVTNVAASVARMLDPHLLGAARTTLRDYGSVSLIVERDLFRDHMAAHRTFVEMAMPQALTISQEIDRLTRQNQPIYNALSDELADRARTLHAALGLEHRGAGVDFAAKLGQPKRYFDELQRHLHVDRPAAGLAGLAAASGVLELRDVMGEVAALRPGYQLAAAVGFASAGARGVVADLLRHYEIEPSGDAPVFAAALQTTHTADGPIGDAEQIDALWARVLDLEAEVRENPDPLARQGRLEIIMVICTIIGTLMGAAALGVGAAALGVQVADFRASEADRQSDALNDKRRAAFETQVLQEQARTRAEATERDRAMRFIASDGPVRAEPHAQGAIVQHVYAGQMARAKDQRDGWVLVEVFSYAPEVSVIGWLPARRLRGRP